MFDFGAFQEKLHMLSRAKYLLRRLFGAFQDTPRSMKIRVHGVAENGSFESYQGSIAEHTGQE